MKKYILILSIISITGLLFFSFTKIDDEDRKNKIIMQMIAMNLQSEHFSQINIDDTFSKKAFKLYIQRMDYSKRFFTQDDIKQLEIYADSIDNEMLNGTFSLYNTAVNIYRKRISEIESFYKEILAKPLDLSLNETIEFDPDKRGFPKDDYELKELWRKSLKQQVLEKISLSLRLQEDAKERNDTSYQYKTNEELEQKAREELTKTYDEFIKRTKQVKDYEEFALYANSITNAFDPHSEYFPPKQKEDFDIQMAGKFEGIGATLQERDGYIKVIDILAGSASWRQGELQVNDVILKVAQANNEPVSIVDMRIDDAVKLIRGPKGSEVRLTVKKVDGTIKIIPIIRDIVILEETFAKSTILQDENQKIKVGYIYLPRFYSDFQDAKGRHCAEDIKTEIEKLKKDKVDGIILDLRNNGGGSLQDVVDMSGLFIEKGPVVQVKSRVGRPYILNDEDSKIFYEGPFIIMVNFFSASASEIIAAAMQDYGRAVIIGSPSTYGKGTVQRFYDFDRMLNKSYWDLKPMGALKITTQKFYRINGGATQLKGVTPDIILPDSYAYIEIGEKEVDYAMPWDEISKLYYSNWKAPYKLDKIKEKSKKRIAENETFRLLEENALRLKKEKDETIESLNITKFLDKEKNKYQENKKYSKIGKKETGIVVVSNKTDSKEMQNDTLKISKANKWHAELKKDVYLKEAVNVMKDMVGK